MKELKNTTKLCKQILTELPDSRNSDNILYYYVCKVNLEKIGIDIDRVSLESALLHRNTYGLPNFETVRRTRQKIQAEFPELSGSNAVEIRRMEREEIFREFARGVLV
jgi:hypothetical protein